MIKIPSRKISKLDLSNQNLTSIPDSVLNLKNLRKLNLSNNRIISIPKEIESLKNLEMLDLSNNGITNFYAKLCSLQKLTVLNLNNNKIKTVPKQIGNLKRIRTLQLANNKISSLPVALEGLVNLRKLNLSKNDFTEFPIEILKVISLKRLWISNLQLKSFSAFDVLTKLINLNGLYCYGQLANSNSANKEYLRLSRVKGNCLVELIQLTESPKQNLTVPKPLPKINQGNSKIQKNKIFLSYSHTDKEWLTRVQTNLKVLMYNDYDFDLWDDTRIKSGNKWKTEIQNALENSGIAILIISTDFLISEFVRSNELPTILKNAEENGTKILPLIVRHCLFKKDKHLSIFQAVNDPNRPLSSLKEADVEKELVKLTEDVADLLS